MISLTGTQYKIALRALKIISERKRRSFMLGEQIGPCAIITAAKILKGHPLVGPASDLSQYDYMQICRAIILPNTILFFMSHDTGEPDCALNLATFIEDNSFDVTF